MKERFRYMKEKIIGQIVENLMDIALGARKHIDNPRRAAGESALSHHRIFCLAYLSQIRSTSMSALAQKAGVSSQQLTRIVNELEEAGCVERSVGENNRRQVIVRITEKGDKETDGYRRHAYEYMQKKFSAFSESELEDLLFHLNALTEYWKKFEG